MHLLAAIAGLAIANAHPYEERTFRPLRDEEMPTRRCKVCPNACPGKKPCCSAECYRKWMAA
jgi:hypothetical protein